MVIILSYTVISQEVGCDLELHSTTKLDKCGVCGGDGSSCMVSRYGWRREAMTECSVSCGGGRVLVHYVCKKAYGNQKVEEGFCDGKIRPKPVSMACNEFDCPARLVGGI